MRLKTFIQKIALSVLAMGFVVSSFSQDSATFDPQQGVWRLYYQDSETDQWVNKSYVTQTAIEPSIKTTVRWADDHFTYDYRIKNGRHAKQTIGFIRIWGIPHIFQAANQPQVTGNITDSPQLWSDQVEARNVVKRAFENKTIRTPKGWSGSIRIDQKVNQTSFVWVPGLKDTDSDGIKPGQSEAGFAVMRPELPGVARTLMQGRTAEPWGLDNLPSTPFWSQKVDEIQDQDYLLVPVLAPVIAIPQPYNGAELARRIKAHVQIWVKYGHATPAMVERLNRQFDALIPALEMGNKTAVRAAFIAMLTEVFRNHENMKHEQSDEDDDAHDALALPHKLKKNITVAQPIDRIAARALVFDMKYLLTRAEIEK
jgi:hypothetical protein